MIGNGLLAFAVIIIVGIFIYLSFREKKEDDGTKKYYETYNIELISGFAGHPFSVYINDSLILNETISTDSFKINVNRFADESALLIVDNETDKLSTFDLSEKGGIIPLRKEGDNILMLGR